MYSSEEAAKDTDSETRSGGDSDYEAPICRNRSWTRDEAIRVACEHAACTDQARKKQTMIESLHDLQQFRII